MNFILVIPLPSTFHQIDWKIVNLPCLKLFCSIYAQIFKNKKVQWMAINSPSDRHKDRNESSDSRTEKHCPSHLLVPSPQDVYTFVPSNNL